MKTTQDEFQQTKDFARTPDNFIEHLLSSTIPLTRHYSASKMGWTAKSTLVELPNHH